MQQLSKTNLIPRLWSSSRIRVCGDYLLPLSSRSHQVYKRYNSSTSDGSMSQSLRARFGNVGGRKGGSLRGFEPLSSNRSAEAGKRTKLYTKQILHALFTKNNMLLTLTTEYEIEGQLEAYKDPSKFTLAEFQESLVRAVRKPQEVRMCLSCGAAGFKGMQRGEYEAGFRTAALFFDKMEQKGFLTLPTALILRGSGRLRQGFEKALTGREGIKISKNIVSVADGTRIKFGGTRSPNRRRI